MNELSPLAEDLAITSFYLEIFHSNLIYCLVYRGPYDVTVIEQENRLGKQGLNFRQDCVSDYLYDLRKVMYASLCK